LFSFATRGVLKRLPSLKFQKIKVNKITRLVITHSRAPVGSSLVPSQLISRTLTVIH